MTAIKKKSGHQRGLDAEGIASWYLRLRGYRILARRYKTPVGEIDLIARRGRCLVFVEVKARGTTDSALHAIHPQQAARITRAAEHYLQSIGQSSGVADSEMRFDVLAVAGAGVFDVLRRGAVVHVRNAF